MNLKPLTDAEVAAIREHLARPERVHIVSDIDHPEKRWRCAALRCGCGNEAYAKRCAYYEALPAPECKHLNLELVPWQSAGLPLHCLDCDKRDLPWTALNNLLTELHAALRGK